MSKLPYGWEDRRNALSERDMKLVRHPAALPAAHRVPPSIPHPGESTPSIRPTEQRAPHRRAPARHQLITPDTRAERSHPSPRPKDSDLTPRRSVPFRSVRFFPMMNASVSSAASRLSRRAPPRPEPSLRRASSPAPTLTAPRTTRRANRSRRTGEASRKAPTFTVRRSNVTRPRVCRASPRDDARSPGHPRRTRKLSLTTVSARGGWSAYARDECD